MAEAVLWAVSALLFVIGVGGIYLSTRKPRPVKITPEWFSAAEEGRVINDPARRPVFVERGEHRRKF
jgi:hypothetical protein